jgi:hypothetical protein
VNHLAVKFYSVFVQTKPNAISRQIDLLCFECKSTPKVPWIAGFKNFNICIIELNQRFHELRRSTSDSDIFRPPPELNPIPGIASRMVTVHDQPKVFMKFVFTPD